MSTCSAALARRTALTVIAALTLAVGCQSGPPKRPGGDITAGDYTFAEKRVAFDINEAISKQGVAGVAIALVDDQDIVFERAYGQADKERATPTDTESIFRAGSVSKLFTAVAIMQLVEAGSIDLDAPITTYIPEFEVGPPPPWFGGEPEGAQVITVRRMMTHQSGLFGDMFKNMMDEKAPSGAKEVIAHAATSSMSAPADEVHAYSNVAYALLGEVIARVSNEAFADYVENHIFAPCQMKRSAFVLENNMLGMFAQPHKKGVVKPHYLIGMYSAGSLYTTVGDLARFCMMLLAGGDGKSGSVLSPESITRMWAPQNDAVKTRFDSRIGLTFFIDEPLVPGADRSVGHGGATMYHRASVVLLPKEKLAAVALSNSAEAHSGEYTKTLLTAALASKTGVREPKVPEIQDGAMDKKTMDMFVGEWATQMGYVVVKRDEDNLLVRALNQDLIFVPTKSGGVRIAAKVFWLFTVMPDELKRFQLQVAELEGRTVLIAVDAYGRRAFFGDKLISAAAAAKSSTMTNAATTDAPAANDAPVANDAKGEAAAATDGERTDADASGDAAAASDATTEPAQGDDAAGGDDNAAPTTATDDDATQAAGAPAPTTVQPFPTPHASWAARAGKYVAQVGPTEGKLFDSIRLELKKRKQGDRLLFWLTPADDPQRIPFVLYAPDAEQAWVYGRGRNLGVSIRVIDDVTLEYQGLTWVREGAKG